MPCSSITISVAQVSFVLRVIVRTTGSPMRTVMSLGSKPCAVTTICTLFETAPASALQAPSKQSRAAVMARYELNERAEAYMGVLLGWDLQRRGNGGERERTRGLGLML